MEGGFDPDATLDYVQFHLFPSQNRYEASAWSGNKELNVASGPLEQLLLLDSPEIKASSTKGAGTKFKILQPENVNDASWFTTATLTRFLHVIGLPDILTVGKEICQLEETRNFQLSLSDNAEADKTTSTESKNELLAAVDLRITSLKEELASTFNQSICSKSSPNDISNIKTFTLHFGTKNLRESIQNSIELNTTPTEDDEDSIVSSEDADTSVERSRGLTRSAMPRRSASPMRRIQIGRSGSRRAASLSIKSLNYFPAKSTSNRDAEAFNSSEEEAEEESKRPLKNSVFRMSVQDKISLFESKQRDQGVDVHKSKTSVGNKAVLRRWSSEIGQKAEISSPISSPSSPKNVNPDTCVETSENVLLVSEQCKVEVDQPVRDEGCEKNNATVDWNQQKGAELNDMFNELMESKAVGGQNMTVNNSINKNPKEQRGGLYDLYKKKREEKFQTEASRKIIEKEAKLTPTKVMGSNKRLNATNEVKKTQKNPTQSNNSRTKPSPVKKSTSTPLPSARKSWPSTPSPAKTQVTSASTNSTPTNRKPQTASPIVRSGTKAENVQPKLKTVKATQQDGNKTTKAMNEKKQTKVTENKRMAKTNVRSPKADTSASAKPSFYDKVTKKNSVVPLETKPFLRKGSRIGPVIKTKVVAPKNEENKVVTRIDMKPKLEYQSQENECEQSENHDHLDLETEVVNLSLSLSPTKCEESEGSGDGDGSREEVSESHIITEQKVQISPTAWVVSEEQQQDEIMPCKEGPIEVLSLANVETPGGFVRPRVRHSLSQMLLEDNEDEVGEWGNAEHPPTMVYQKDAPRGFKRLLKFARKAKADSHITAGWSSPSAFSEGEDDAEESKGQSSFSRYNVQNHQGVTEGPVSASMNTTKATRSFFSLSAFRGNKTNETKLLHH